MSFALVSRTAKGPVTVTMRDDGMRDDGMRTLALRAARAIDGEGAPVTIRDGGNVLCAIVISSLHLLRTPRYVCAGD